MRVGRLGARRCLFQLGGCGVFSSFHPLPVWEFCAGVKRRFRHCSLACLYNSKYTDTVNTFFHLFAFFSCQNRKYFFPAFPLSPCFVPCGTIRAVADFVPCGTFLHAGRSAPLFISIYPCLFRAGLSCAIAFCPRHPPRNPRAGTFLNRHSLRGG